VNQEEEKSRHFSRGHTRADLAGRRKGKGKNWRIMCPSKRKPFLGEIILALGGGGGYAIESEGQVRQKEKRGVSELSRGRNPQGRLEERNGYGTSKPKHLLKVWQLSKKRADLFTCPGKANMRVEPGQRKKKRPC